MRMLPDDVYCHCFGLCLVRNQFINGSSNYACNLLTASSAASNVVSVAFVSLPFIIGNDYPYCTTPCKLNAVLQLYGAQTLCVVVWLLMNGRSSVHPFCCSINYRTLQYCSMW